MRHLPGRTGARDTSPCYTQGMDAPKKRRFRFGLRTLLGVVALVGVALYFRPGQVNAIDAPKGATKAWVYWNCGPNEGDYVEDAWVYTPADGTGWTFVEFDGRGRVAATGKAEISSAF